MAEQHFQLTPNSVMRLYQQDMNITPRPVLQVADIRLIQKNTPEGKPEDGEKKYRIMISDGVHYSQAMLTGKLNDLVTEEKIRKYTIFRLDNYFCNTVQGRRITIGMDLEILGHAADVIGQPAPVEKSPAAQQQPPPSFTGSDTTNNYAAGGNNGGGNNNQGGYGGQGGNYGGGNNNQGGYGGQGGNYGGGNNNNQGGYGGQGGNYGGGGGNQGNYGNQGGGNGGGGGYGGNNNQGGYGSSGGGYGGNNNQGGSGGGDGGGHGGNNNQGGYGGGGGGGYGNNNNQGGYGGGGGGGYGNNNQGGYGGGGAGYGSNNNQGGYGGGGGASYGGGPAPQYGQRGSVSRNEAPARIVSISSLNPYQNRWTIRARVTNHGGCRTYHNAKGEGRVMNFDLLDSEGGEIRCVAFGDAALKFDSLVQQGRVYYISKGQLSTSRNMKYALQQYEIRLDMNSQVEECPEDSGVKIAKIHFNFKKVAEIEQVPAGNLSDVLGVVHSVGDLTTIMKRDGSETQKRSIILRDDSGASVELTLWAPQANEVGGKLETFVASGDHPVLAIKNGRVGEFQGKNIGTISSTVIDINPDLDAAVKLRQWYEGGGAKETANALSGQGGSGGGGRSDRWVTLAQLREETQQQGANPAFWVQCRCHVTYIKAADTGCMYPACPLKNGDRMCQKKLRHDETTGAWQCERHAGEEVPHCEWRYLINMTVADHTGNAWVSVFGDMGDQIMGMSAGQLKDLMDNNYEKYEKALSDANFSQYVMKLKVHEDTYNDDTRVKMTLARLEKIDFVDHSRKMIEQIAKLHAGESIEEPRPLPSAPGSAAGGGVGGGYGGSGGGGGYGGGGSSGDYGGGGYGGGGYGGAGGGYGGGGYGGGGGGWNQGGGGAGSDYGGGAGGGGGGGGGGSGNCYKCGQPGHWARDCPNSGGGGGGGYGGGGGGGYGGGGGFM